MQTPASFHREQGPWAGHVTSPSAMQRRLATYWVDQERGFREQGACTRAVGRLTDGGGRGEEGKAPSTVACIWLLVVSLWLIY